MTGARQPSVFDAGQRLAWLRLWRSENVGPRTFQVLLERFGSAEAALDALPRLARRSGRPITLASVAEIEREMEAAERCGAFFLCRNETAYPPLLREIDAPPAVIAVRGQASVLRRPAVAIVGSRNASAAGLVFAERLSRALASAGYVVVSGFARGIDARAHRGSLGTGTVAVLAGGHDRLYPADQGPLMDRILEDGAAISEMPFGWEARGRDFPRRNRLVSGLSLGTVVVEAARRSGSLITARFAGEQGRDVFAVPGSPCDPRAEGTNDLLREGAVLCADPDDVIRTLSEGAGRRSDTLADAPADDAVPLWDELDFPDEAAAPALLARVAGILADQPAGEPPPMRATEVAGDIGLDLFASSDAGTTPLERVAAALSPAPVSIDELARAMALPVREVRAALLELELAGRIERHGAGLVSLLTR